MNLHRTLFFVALWSGANGSFAQLPIQRQAGDGPPAAAPTEVTARCIDAAGRPVVGARLLPGVPDAWTVDRVLEAPLGKSDARGLLRVTIPAGQLAKPEFGLLAAPETTVVRVSLAGSLTMRDGKFLRVVDLGTVALRASTSIRGMVRDAGGKPIAGARIAATDVLQSPHLLREPVENCATATQSDAQGRFVLRGVPEAGASLVVHASGFTRVHLPFASQFTPVVVGLGPARRARGQVVGPGGKGIAGLLKIRYGAGQDSNHAVQVGADGKFDVSLWYPGRFRLLFRAPGSGDFAGEIRRSVEGAIRFVVPASEIIPLRVRVRAVAAADGKPVPAFRGVGVWRTPKQWKTHRAALESAFLAGSKPARAGVLEIRAAYRAGMVGRVLIQAPGFAPAWFEFPGQAQEGVLTKTVRLHPEKYVLGVVQDEGGRPLPNVRVTSRGLRTGVMARQIRGLGDSAWTDAQGRFRIGMLGDEPRYFWVGSGPRPHKVRVDVGKRKASEVLKIPLRPAEVLEGKLEGGVVGAGWQIGWRYEPTQFFLPISQDPPVDPRGWARVAPDGTYRLRTTNSGSHRLELVIPYAMGYIRVPMQRANGRGGVIRTDLKTIRPGVLRGRVLATGAPLGPGRLLLIARPKSDPANQIRFVTPFMSPETKGICALIDAAGRYSIPLPKNSYTLRVFDLATGVELGSDPKPVQIRRAGQKVTRNLALRLGLVHVQFRRGKSILDPVRFLEVTPGSPGRKLRIAGRSLPFGMEFTQPPRVKKGRGFDVPAPLSSTYSVVIPLRSMWLRARGFNYQLYPGRNRFQFPPRGELEVDPEFGKISRVVIPLR